VPSSENWTKAPPNLHVPRISSVEIAGVCMLVAVGGIGVGGSEAVEPQPEVLKASIIMLKRIKRILITSS
jgi:hypothetical protein